MSRKIVIHKATRVEGNADIQIEIKNGKLKTARFMIQDFRAFEKIMMGKRVEFVPHLVSRICGLCSVAHQVAGFRAVEDALNIKIPDAVKKLRKIIVLGERISSHALSYFFLSYPDLMGSSKGLFELEKQYPKVAEDAFFLRKSGNRIIEIIGKRAVHPVSLAVGGFNVLPAQEELVEIRRVAEEIKAKVFHLITSLNSNHFNQNSISYPTNQRINFLNFTDDEQRGVFRVFDKDGALYEEFSPDSFEDHISELRVDWSFAKFPYLTHLGFPEGALLVGPIARVFKKGGILTDTGLQPIALTDYLKKNATSFLDCFDSARLLEIYLAAEEILKLLKGLDVNNIKPGKFDYDVSGKGIGVVEAPRGVLVHSYLVNRGKIERLRLLVATQFNNAYINLVLQDIAQAHIQGNVISEKGEKLIGRCVRTFDPCLACATH